MNDKTPVPCENCDGTGIKVGVECRACHGKGYRLHVDGKLQATPGRQDRFSGRPARRRVK